MGWAFNSIERIHKFMGVDSRSPRVRLSIPLNGFQIASEAGRMLGGVTFNSIERIPYLYRGRGGS